jgi:hypothetical protein
MDALALLSELARAPRATSRAEREAICAAASARRDDHVATLIAATQDPALCFAYIQAIQGDWRTLSATERLALVQCEDAKTEAAIDRLLANRKLAPHVCSALARVGVPWTHNAIEDLLDSDKPYDVAQAATVLASYEPEGLYAWCDEAAEADDPAALIALRAAILASEDQTAWEVIDALREDLANDAHANKNKKKLTALDALLAIVNPKRWARGVLREVYAFDWLDHPYHVADALQTHGETSWLETLAMLELNAQSDAFAFAAHIAITASLSLTELTQESQADTLAELLELIRADDPAWAPRAAGLDCHIALALGDEEMTPLLVEAIIHERLLYSGFSAPCLIGLPLSSSDEEGVDVEAAHTYLRELATKEELVTSELVAAVRTLSDLRRWRSLNPELVAPIDADLALLTSLREHPIATIAQATEPNYDLLQLATGQGPASLWAISELAQQLDDPTATLGALWTSAPIERVPYIRMWLSDGHDLGE